MVILQFILCFLRIGKYQHIPWLCIRSRDWEADEGLQAIVA